MIGVKMHDGTRERCNPITLPSKVYLNKSIVSKTLAKLEADGILQRIQEAYYFDWSSQNYILVDDQNLKKDLNCL